MEQDDRECDTRQEDLGEESEQPMDRDEAIPEFGRLDDEDRPTER